MEGILLIHSILKNPNNSSLFLKWEGKNKAKVIFYLKFSNLITF